MKVTLINTSDAGGGAPAACLRLLKALEGVNVQARLLVQHKKTSEGNVKGIADSLMSSLRAKINFLRERLPFIAFHEKNKSMRFAFSTANAGMGLTKEPWIAEADILHLHWTNSGFLSISDLKGLINLGKPVVWTLHDMWAFTGGCHYSGSCDHFKNHCGNCWLLRNAGEDDLSHSGWLRKAALFAGAKNVTFVTCSKWLAGVARQSSLLKHFRIEAIPNPINTLVFSPKNKTSAREKWGISPFAKVILFGAANINDKRKGLAYLLDALEILKSDYSPSDIEVVIFGKNKHFDVSILPFKVHAFSMIGPETELAELYSLADVFVTPSLEDNLPNMVMEAMACGTPVVAFNTGGLPEMIDHQQNGFLAELRSAPEFAQGIFEMLHAERAETLALNARNKVLRAFNAEKVAGQYTQLYLSILKNG